MSGPGNKRAAGDSGSGPSEKKVNREEKTTTTLIEPIRLGGISSTEEMDLKVLQFKNKKLAERLEQRQAFEDELRERIEKLEKRQATDDATLLIVNRYWSHLDENVQSLLHSYDTDCNATTDTVSAAMESQGPETESHCLVPTETELQRRPEEAEHLEKTGLDTTSLAPASSIPEKPDGGLNDPTRSFLQTLASSSNEEMELQIQDRMEFSKKAVSRIVEASNKLHRRIEDLCQKIHCGSTFEQLDELVKSLNKDLSMENRRLQDLATQLQEKHHRISLQYNELQDKVCSSETKVSEMETTIEDLQWDIEKLRKREQKLNKHLAEALEQLNSGYHVSGSSGSFQGGQITLTMQKFEMLNTELEGNLELATSRMAELEKLQNELQTAVRLKEKLKMDLRNIPEDLVKDTHEYKCLQAQFSLLYNESLQVKTQLDEVRALLLTTKNSHLRQIEHMESDELGLQKKLRTEVIQLEDTLAQVRKEYEMLRIEFEQNLAANEQAGPINREMRHLIGSLQNHNHQLKGDVQRYKRKLREAQAEMNKIRVQMSSYPSGSTSLPSTPGDEAPPALVKEEEAMEVKNESKDSIVKEKEELPPREGKKEEEEPKRDPERPKGRDRERDNEKDKEGGRERDRERDRDQHRERDRDRDREKERDRDREKERDKDREKDRDKDREKDRDKDREKDRDKDREKDRDKDREKDRDKDREKDRDKDREKDRDKDREKDRDKDREKDRDKDREKDRDKDREKDRDKDREKDRDKDREKDRDKDREKDRDKDREKDRDKDREKDRDKDREKDRDKDREKDRDKDREKDRDKDREKDRDKDREKEKDKDREKDRDKDREKERDKEREKDRDKDRDRDRDKEKQKAEESKKKDSDMLKQLRSELKKAQESQKEMKLLLDMYKSAPKEQRDKVQLMAAEKKTKAEVEELRLRIRDLEEKEKRESKKMADEDALRKIKVAEEQIDHLQKKLGATKQEEALLSEMDVTGQAFEDMQEQNMRLMQQLREKDDANFKLMSERIKSNQIHKLLREEKDELADQVLALKSQVDSQLLLVQKLEEKERVLQSNLCSIEKELTMRTQALELNKRKAVEAAQLSEDLKVQLEHVQCKLKEIQTFMSENRTAKEKESFNLKRAQEDISRIRRKLEKQKKVEVYADADEILQEEIKEYKAKLTCPCCNTRKKDAVLTKCFHVFCFECVKTRYDTRQRKCPKCNAAFGAHDFHRIYIS
ncbi:E3 ubiquitin-protein ligase BRE1B isoform X2 [Ambystoma mexicanum]|uniref:E3 ubiquitin-protein ligase BRE1B isoform X2 n=1 Tax=Ambystoma mexicanum TaxID=8296 RepID=UPI0037E836D0